MTVQVKDKDLHALLNLSLTFNDSRLFQVNLDRTCPFWADDSRCSLKDCHVDQCEEVLLK